MVWWQMVALGLGGGVLCAGAGALGAAAERAGAPRIEEPWWTIAGDPDLGPLTDLQQQPVDFGIWQAADGSWQLWSCIRHTKCGGKTRLFHRWEAQSLTDKDWTPKGIALQADPALGETPGGLQAPFVARIGGVYHLFYGDWEHICLGTSTDGKTFARHRGERGCPALFSEAPSANTRDPVVLRAGELYHCYYTAHPEQQGAVYCRTSADLRTWSGSRRVAFGGAAGTGLWTAECPFVVYRDVEKRYYLFRTQRYGQDAQTTVYASPDPFDFGVNDDRYRVCALPVAAPELLVHEGTWYIAALLPGLKGIRMARLRW